MAMGKSDRTQGQIIEGAIRALAKSGVGGATTRKIATEAGVQLATLHYHFDTKSALLLAALDAMIGEMTQSLRGEVRLSDDIDECVERILKASWRFVMQTRELQIVQYELTLYALREGAGGLAERQYAAYVQVYFDLLRNALQGPDTLTSAQCRAVARMMLAGVDGLILQELATPNRSRSRRSIDALIRSTQGYIRSLKTERGDATEAGDLDQEAALGRLAPPPPHNRRIM
jgi:AcrR family transcriptional regulator